MDEQAQVDLASLTTMRVGGPARRLVTASTTDELVDAVREVDDADEPLLVLSGGSNVLVSDEGFDGTVVQVATRGVRVESADACGGAFVTVAAGESWDGLVARAVELGWAGIEALSGIPGLVGATPIQNVGAYGQEVAQTVARVRVWDRHDQRVLTLAAADCGFGYRHSRFKGTDRYVVLEVSFQLEIADLCRPLAYAALAAGLDVPVGTRVPLADAREAVLAQRRLRGMVLDPGDHDTWSCGSFFTNPIVGAQEFAAVVEHAARRLGPDAPIAHWPAADGSIKLSAAWLIEHSGFGKGYGAPGPATLSSKHTLALTNRGSARAADVLALARAIRDGVHAAYGVVLVNEPVFVGLDL